MEWSEILKIITAVLASVGTAATLMLALSSWLGKVWAEKILEKEKLKYAKELESTKRDLDFLKETTLKAHNDKIAIYRMTVDVISEILSALDAHASRKLNEIEARESLETFNRKRMQVYGYLAMLAPQAVMDAQDQLIDHLLQVVHGTKPYNWIEVRKLSINLINTVRADIAIEKNSIVYNGVL